jgi:hypothetical protein
MTLSIDIVDDIKEKLCYVAPGSYEEVCAPLNGSLTAL